MPSLARCFSYRLHLLSKLTDKATHARYMDDLALPLGEARCLATIGAFSTVRVADLALQANLDKGTASRGAQALVARGLVRKAPSATDGRSIELSLTTAGRQHYSHSLSIIEQRNREMLECLTPAEQAQLGQLLDRLIAHARGP